MRPYENKPEDVLLPFPLSVSGNIKAGFARGSSELGIPTANIPVSEKLKSLECGIYFGWCKLSPNNLSSSGYIRSEAGKEVYFNNGESLRDDDVKPLPMVMSIGWNPFYNNTEKAAEVHIIHDFTDCFYGAKINISILGYLRPELNYTSKGTFFFFFFIINEFITC